MALEISVSVRDQAIALNTQGRVAEAWSLLARSGDNYAASAYQVVADPTSAYGQIVRNHWKAANADFSKFNTVAEDYQARYLSSLGAGSTPGTVKLPSTTAIESSYIGALDDNGITRYAAVDAVIEAARRVPGKENELHWYEALKIEPGRFGPPASEINSFNPGQAAQIYYKTVGHTRETMLYTLNQDVSYFNNTIGSSQGAMDWHAQQMGTKGITTFQAGGLTYFYNEVTGNMAAFDANGVGRAYIDGQRISINPDNWWLDPASKQYQYNTDGTWKVAEANGASTDITFASNGTSANTVDIQATSAASGLHTLIAFDQASTMPWTTDTKVYDARGQIDTQSTTYDNGTRADTDYDQANASPTVDSTTSVYDSAKRLDWTDTRYDLAAGGGHTVVDHDQSNAAGWDHVINSYNRADQLTRSIVDLDGANTGSTDTRWDRANAEGWDHVVNTWTGDGGGGLLARSIVDFDGAGTGSTDTRWDRANAEGWDHVVNTWTGDDGGGLLASSIVDFDGVGTGSTQTRWDLGNTQGWEAVTNEWTGDDAGGLLRRSVQDLDGATTGSLETKWDLANAEGWEAVTNTWTGSNADGGLLRSVVDKDGNTGFIDNKFDPRGTQNYTWWSTYTDANNNVYLEDARYDTGQLAGGYYRVDHDPYNQHNAGQDAWSAWYRNYDVNGVLQQQFVKWDNMTSGFWRNDMNNDPNWGSSYTTYGATGTVTSHEVYNDAGIRISETGGGQALALTILLFSLTW